MKKTIKVIDLLNMNSKGGELPKKINYDGLIYIFDIAENDYISEKADYYNGDYITHKYLTESFEFDILNDEVEILDEEEFEDIEEIKIYTDFGGDFLINDEGNKCKISSHDKKIINRLNKVIKNQKKIIERLKESE